MYSLALQLSQEKKINWQAVSNIKESTVKRNTAASTYHNDRGYASAGSMALGQTNTSRSEPGLPWRYSVPKLSVPSQRVATNRDTYRAERATSQFITSTIPQPQPQYTVNGTGQTRRNSQFVCSQVDMSKAPPKPTVTECAPKSKGESR